MKKFSCIIFSILFAVFILQGCHNKTEGTQSSSSNVIQGNGLVVLCYHRIIPTKLLITERNLDPQESELKYYTIGKDEFISQLKHLKQSNVKFVTPLEAENYLAKKQTISGKLVLVTLDDGDLSIYKNAYPELKKLKIPFLLFMITSQAGKQWEGFHMCTWSQLKEMQESGYCTVGLHTYDMHYIGSDTKQPVFLNKKNKKLFSADTKKGIESLKKHLGVNTAFFAYPYGFGNADTDSILMSNGINNIFSLSGKINHPGDKRFFIGRYLVTEDNWKKIASWAGS